MAKRPKWLDHALASLPEDLRHYMNTGFFKDEPPSHFFWIAWVAALEEIDKRKDKGRLLELLRSEYPMPPEARFFLADLLERHQLKNKRGGRATPAYDQTVTDRLLEWVDGHARLLISCRTSAKDACEKAATEFFIPLEIFMDFHNGKRGGSVRMKKRRSP